MCLRLRVDSGVVVFITTAMLTHNKLMGPSTDKHITLSLYIRASIKFIDCFVAIKSE